MFALQNNICWSRVGPLALLASLLLPAIGAGQDEIQTQLGAEPGPYFVGLPVTIQLTATGLSDRGTPEVEVESDSDALRWTLVATNPTSIRFNNNGRISSQSKYDFIFRFTASKAGQWEIGPFVITDGSIEKRVDAVKVTFEEVPTTDNMQIHLRVPEGPFFPEQRVPVEIEWWYAGDLANTGVSISSPLFDTFKFEDEKPTNVREALLPIDTAEGSVDLQATVREELVDGKRFRVFRAKRTMIPDRIGTFAIDPIQVTIRHRVLGRRQRRDDTGFGFGFFDRVEEYVKSVEAFRAVGEPMTIVIGGFPKADQPESFAGAVGKGFSIAVTADRTVVRVGDPIRLNVTLRGSGNLKGASLPPLSADGGMDPERFRLPSGDIPGKLGKDEKTFSVSVRVEDESVSEIPSIAYSWFDTDAKQYRTARSAPIALRVMPADMISADDVVSAGRGPSSDPPPAGDEPSSAAGQPRKRFSLSGADLAIESNPAAMLSTSSRSVSPVVVQTTAYLAGIAIVMLALVDRRRSQADPAVVARRKVAVEQAAAIAAAAGKPQRQGANEVAAALRSLLASQPGVERSSTEALIGECEALVYQPSSAGDEPLSREIIERAQQLANRFRKEAQ
ncbi:BatD family protein [Rosistilla oblonga]|uniref:BatD family protein n=1 Tax=Rosistilla oblonga TaxID=2527990 RepID=UPI003A984798